MKQFSCGKHGDMDFFQIFILALQDWQKEEAFTLINILSFIYSWSQNIVINIFHKFLFLLYENDSLNNNLYQFLGTNTTLSSNLFINNNGIKWKM